MYLSKNIVNAIKENIEPILLDFLKNAKSQIDYWAIHPGGPRILTAVAEGLNLPHETLADSQAVLADCGNMSSPTILFILERLRRRNAPRRLPRRARRSGRAG